MIMKRVVRRIIDRFKESSLYWVICGDRDLNLSREESRKFRYGKADKRAQRTE